ncbi:MAG: hypothetical protein ACXWWU_01985 [Candidatus Limnocylindria bacterium]
MTRWLPRLRRPPAVLLTLLLVVGPGSGIAVADHGGRDIGSFMACDRPVDPPRCTSVGDDRLHLVAFDGSLREDLAVALRASMAEDYDAPTQLHLVEQPRVTPLTDVIAFSGDYGDNGAAGWVYCPSDAPQGINRFDHRWCRNQELHLNYNARYGLFFDDEASRGHIACHELGHTLGLRHWGNPPETEGAVGATCMNANTPNGPTSLHQTDIDHVNRYRFPVIPTPAGVRIVRAPAPAVAFLGISAGPLHALETGEATSLEELIDGSDAVVHARITAIEPGRVFGPSSRPLHYAAATVEVIGLLAGDLPGDHRAVLTLEIPLFDGPDAIEGLRAVAVGSERVLFLRNKGASAAAAGMSAEEQAVDAAFYRLTTFAAEIVEADGSAVVPEDERGLLSPMATGSFEQAIRLVRAAAED